MKLNPEMLLLYKEDRLGQEEKQEVEAYLANNPEGNQMLEEFDELDHSLESWAQVHRVRDNVLQAVKQESKRPNVIQMPQFRGAAIPTAVAACFVIALTGLLYMMESQSPGIKELSQTGSVMISKLDSDHHKIKVESDSFLALKMADEKSITEYAPNTIATITGPRSLNIQQGSVWNEVGKDKSGKQYTVETQHGTVIVLGTQFEVEVDNNQTTVRLLEGSVKLVQKDGSEKMLVPNQQGVMKTDSNIQLKKITVDDIASWRKQFIGKGIDTRAIHNGLQATKNR